MATKTGRAPRAALDPSVLATFTEKSVVAPDTTPYTTFCPTSSTASCAGFQKISIPIGGGQAFSYSLQFRLTSFGAVANSGLEILTLKDGLEAVGGVTVSYTTGGFGLFVQYRDGTFLVAPALEVDRWYDLAFTWDGTAASVYLDGGVAPFGAAQLSRDVVRSPDFTIGKNARNPPRDTGGLGPLVGDVRRFYVWKKLLSAADVVQQMWSAPDKPVYESEVILGYDFTTHPPTRIGSGPNLSAKNLGYASSSTALFSVGRDVATPGQGTAANPGGGSPFSILAWVYVGNLARNPPRLDGYVVSNGDATDPKHIGVRLAGGKIVVEIGSRTVQSTTTLSGYTWYYVGVTYDGSKCSIYINNSLDASGAVRGEGTPPAGAMRLFGILRNGQPADTLQGYLQFLSIWNEALTAEQVAQQAYEDPTLDPRCTANFMMSTQPALDSRAVKSYGLWSANQLQLGPLMLITQIVESWSAESASITAPRRPEPQPISIATEPLRLGIRFARMPPPAIAPFSPEHRALLVSELASALSYIGSKEYSDRLLDDFRKEVDRAFDLAATSPDQLEGPYVSYRLVEGAYALFYHPDAQTEIDLGVRIDISEECLAWWAMFVLTAILGALAAFGLPTPGSLVGSLARAIATDPNVIATLQTVTGLTFAAGTLLSFLKVLYDFGWLSQAFWLALSKLGWWQATQFILYFVGIFAPVASPQKVVFIANTITTVTQMVLQLTKYSKACGMEEV
jgi:hypothetical protein